MKKRYNLLLQLFAVEGAEGGNGETGDTVADAGQESITTDADGEFDMLIRDKFKDQFSRKTQAIIDKRFKETKELEAYRTSVSPVVDMLMEKYELEPGNEGMLGEMLKASFEREAGSIRAESEQTALRRDALRERVGTWVRDSESLKELYPEFDLRTELKSQPLFSQLVLAGAPLKSAYEVVHRDEILGGAMAYTADKVREQMVHDIEAKGRRPVENGVASQGAIVSSVDVSALSSDDILKILRQVEKGAKITF